MDDDPPTSVAGSDTEEETQAPPVMNEPAKANIVDDDSPTSIVPSDSMEEDDDPPTTLALSDTEDANNLSVPFEQPCRQTEKSSTGAEVCTDTVVPPWMQFRQRAKRTRDEPSEMASTSEPIEEEPISELPDCQAEQTASMKTSPNQPSEMSPLSPIATADEQTASMETSPKKAVEEEPAPTSQKLPPVFTGSTSNGLVTESKAQPPPARETGADSTGLRAKSVAQSLAQCLAKAKAKAVAKSRAANLVCDHEVAQFRDEMKDLAADLGMSRRALEQWCGLEKRKRGRNCRPWQG